MSTSTLLAGKCCLVTGSSDPKSIGYACAHALMQSGTEQVCISGRTNVDQAAKALKCHGIVSDFYQPESMKTVVEAAVEKMGGKLDIVIIAGANGGSEYLGMDIDDLESYRKLQDVAVHSPMVLCKSALPYLKQAANGGSIVMVTSMASHVPWPPTAPYNLAKAAQNCLVETLAFDYRNDNVRVNAVLPACIHTGYLDIMAEKKDQSIEEYAQLRAKAHPMQRNGTPEEVAQAVLYLASPMSSFTTGELLKVDGGLHLSNWFNKPKILDEYVGGNLTGSK